MVQINNVDKLFEQSLQQSQLSEKQQQVLTASLNLFAEKGFDRTSSKNIAERAGVSEGTVFKQFKTKEGILAALLDPFVAEVVPMAATEFVTELANGQFNDFQQFLAYAVQDRLTFALKNQRLLKVFIQEVMHNQSVLQSLIDKVHELAAGPVGALLKQFQQTGQLVDWPALRIIQYVGSILVGYAFPRVLMGSNGQFDIQQKSQEATEFLLRGLQP